MTSDKQQPTTSHDTDIRQTLGLDKSSAKHKFAGKWFWIGRF